MRDIPPTSHLEIIELPHPLGAFDLEVYALHSGSFPEDGSALEVYGGASFTIGREGLSRTLDRIRRAFPNLDPDHQQFLRNPHITAEEGSKGTYVNLFMNLKYTENPNTLVQEAALPFVQGFERITQPSVHVFICHASEDKASARVLASEMKNLGADVWFDEWEIKVGESIVQKINAALGIASHILVLLSRTSVHKPWVQKELSSALMQQLSTKRIVVSPLRLDDCDIPPILADIWYADARKGMEYAVKEIERALFTDINGDGA